MVFLVSDALHFAFLFRFLIGMLGNDRARDALLEIILFYTLLSAGAVVFDSSWWSSSVYRA